MRSRSIPGNYRARDTETLLRLMYDGLATHDRQMKVVPELASGWQVRDPVTYEFTLRKDVKLHGGGVLTADDVVFTFTRLLKDGAMNGQTSPRKGLLGPLKTVAAWTTTRCDSCWTSRGRCCRPC